MAGSFVDPAVFCKLALPHLEASSSGSSSNCSRCLRILAGLLRGSNPQLLKPHLKVGCFFSYRLCKSIYQKFDVGQRSSFPRKKLGTRLPQSRVIHCQTTLGWLYWILHCISLLYFVGNLWHHCLTRCLLHAAVVMPTASHSNGFSHHRQSRRWMPSAQFYLVLCFDTREGASNARSSRARGRQPYPT